MGAKNGHRANRALFALWTVAMWVPTGTSNRDDGGEAGEACRRVKRKKGREVQRSGEVREVAGNKNGQRQTKALQVRCET